MLESSVPIKTPTPFALTPYDPTFSAEIGGYPSGALIPAASITGSFWLSTVDNNLTDPDTGGADWQPWPSASINIVP